MYRYSRHVSASVSNVRAQKRAMAIVILALLIALIVVSVIAVSASRRSNDADRLFLAQMRAEVGSAITELNRISSTGGSGTFTRLALIRQHVYAMDQINQLSVELGAGSLAPQEAFDALYADLETFDNNLQTASRTLEVQTKLSNDLAALQEILAAIE